MTSSQPARATAPLRVAPSTPARPAHTNRPRADVDDRLDHLGRVVVKRASTHGIGVEYLGTGPLFSAPRLYGEGTAPWILTPAETDPMVRGRLPIPVRQAATLRQLVDAGMDFPAIYLAHQLEPVPGAKPDAAAFDCHRPVSLREVERLLGPLPVPKATRRTAARLDRSAGATARAARAVGVGVALGAVAPFLAVGAVLEGLDPAVVGALTLPGHGYRPDTPAAWFLLAHWNW